MAALGAWTYISMKTEGFMHGSILAAGMEDLFDVSDLLMDGVMTIAGNRDNKMDVTLERRKPIGSEGARGRCATLVAEIWCIFQHASGESPSVDGVPNVICDSQLRKEL